MVLCPPHLACGFVHRSVKGVAINGGGTGVHPDLRRMGRATDGLPDDARGPGSRFQNLAAIGLRVTTVHAAPGEIDHEIGIFSFGGPGAKAQGVPLQDPPRRRNRPSHEHHDGVPVAMKVPGEQCADLTGTAGENDS